jgi:hypothetical protein
MSRFSFIVASLLIICLFRLSDVEVITDAGGRTIAIIGFISIAAALSASGV